MNMLLSNTHKTCMIYRARMKLNQSIWLFCMNQKIQRQPADPTTCAVVHSGPFSRKSHC